MKTGEAVAEAGQRLWGLGHRSTAEEPTAQEEQTGTQEREGPPSEGSEQGAVEGEADVPVQPRSKL